MQNISVTGARAAATRGGGGGGAGVRRRAMTAGLCYSVLMEEETEERNEWLTLVEKR